MSSADSEPDGQRFAKDYTVSCELENTTFVVYADERPDYCPGCGRGLD